MTAGEARALIVEDDASWQQILSELLSDAGLEVDVADNVEAAIERLRATPHRLAVVDLSLSRGESHNRDGLRVLDAARRLDPACATVLLTGFATVELAVSALTEYDALTCLRKESFDRGEFRDLIAEALAAPSHVEAPDGEAAGTGEAAGRALVVEDDAGWRGILAELLTDAGYEVDLCAGFGEGLGCLRRERYDLAVVDLYLEGSGVADALLRRRRGPEEPEGYRLLDGTREADIPTVVVSGAAAPDDIERAYAEHGIFAFIEKQVFDRGAFLRTVEEARAATTVGDELACLTSREMEVLELVVQGMTNKQIAGELFISTNTVKRHLKSIFQKLDVHSRTAAAAIAVDAGVAVE